MDWDTYKTLSHQPEYFTRWALERTVPYLEDSLQELVLRQASGTPLNKPADHKGGRETDVLQLELQSMQVAAILSALETVRAATKLAGASLQPNLHGLINSWQEYSDWLNE